MVVSATSSGSDDGSSTPFIISFLGLRRVKGKHSNESAHRMTLDNAKRVQANKANQLLHPK
jgi:hypothetical protein